VGVQAPDDAEVEGSRPPHIVEVTALAEEERRIFRPAR
jgi:hypothetical protein